ASVDINSSGSFVIAFTQYHEQPAPLGSTTVLDSRVHVRKYNPLGELMSGRLVSYDAMDPSVSMNNHGDFVVAYAHQESAANFGVHAKQFTSRGGYFLAVSIATNYNRFRPTVALSEDGTYVVAFQSQFWDGGLAGDSDVLARQLALA